MSVLVKICGLRAAEQVDVAVAAGADAVGFVFARSVRQIDPAAAREISATVPAHVRRVAVMLHPSNAEWQAVLEGFTPDVLQTDSQDFATLDVPDSVECWPVYRQGGVLPVATGSYIFEGPKSGQGETVNWSEAARLAADSQMILAGGLGVANVAAAIATARPFGVDVSSGVESAPGIKDNQLINDFISAVRTAEKNL